MKLTNVLLASAFASPSFATPPALKIRQQNDAPNNFSLQIHSPPGDNAGPLEGFFLHVGEPEENRLFALNSADRAAQAFFWNGGTVDVSILSRFTNELRFPVKH